MLKIELNNKINKIKVLNQKFYKNLGIWRGKDLEKCRLIINAKFKIG